MMAAMLVSCSSSTVSDDNKGQYIKMYMPENVYDLDPAHAYYNQATYDVVSLLFSPLFTLNDDGKVENCLVDNYRIEENTASKEYKMFITLKNTNWSDGTYVSANDVVFAWKRILEMDDSDQAAALLYDIKNARAVRTGDCSIDDLCIFAEDELLVTVEFEGKIDYNQFILNLTSLALAPLREDIVTRTDDWAKKPGTMVCSGPFKLGSIDFVKNSSVTYYDKNNSTYDSNTHQNVPATNKNVASQTVGQYVLERNTYYFRDNTKDSAGNYKVTLDKFVTPYKIIVSFGYSKTETNSLGFTKSIFTYYTDEEIAAQYKDGEIVYMGSIPLSLRETYKKDADVTDALSTHTYYLNQNAEIAKKDGTTVKLFANADVRQALSLAIDRDAIAQKVVFAKAATALVPFGVFDHANSGSFRKTGGDIIATSADLDAAKAKLSAAGINASDYTFKITVPAYDEVFLAIADAVVENWKALGFNVSTNVTGTIVNNDYYKITASVPEDVCDDLYAERLRDGDYEVIALDLSAYSADAFGVLAPFAASFSGNAYDMVNNDIVPHITGYNSEAYNALIEKAYNVYYNADIKSSKWQSERATILHDAEKQLLADMAVIPILFNEKATLSDSALKGETVSSYYTPTDFKKCTVSGYTGYYADYIDKWLNPEG